VRSAMTRSHSEIIWKNLIFEIMFTTAKENPTKNAAVSKISLVRSDMPPSFKTQTYHGGLVT
jgi:hypothetical protein